MSLVCRFLSAVSAMLRAGREDADARLLSGSSAPRHDATPERRAAGLAARGRALALVVPTVAVSLSLMSGAADAKLVSYGSFGSGMLDQPMGVAVDQATGDVYVANFDYVNNAPANVFKFDPSGHQISPPSPFGAGSGTYSDVAVNPANGHVSVIDTELTGSLTPQMQTYDPSSGAELSSFSFANSANLVGALTAVQFAVDGSGRLYVPNVPGNSIQVFDSAGNLVQTITGSGPNAMSGPTGVTLDASGNLWVASNGSGQIEEFAPTGNFITSFPSAGVQSLALDASGNVYALDYNNADSCGTLTPPCYHVVEYSGSGAQLDDIGAGTIGTPFFESFGGPPALAVNASSGKVYVVDGGDELIRVFGPPTAPTIGNELAVDATTSTATLGARISPGGLPTSYHFEYGTSTAYGQSAPVPDGDAGSGVVGQMAWATASGLHPNTTYHYRVVATNSVGTVTGPDQTFTTAAGGCPNEQFRTGLSASLPDCRAYEMVTPPNKDSGGVGRLVLDPGDLPGFQVASDGNSVSFFSHDSFPGSLTGSGSYLGTRGASGWSSQNLIPPQSGEYGDRCSSMVGMQLYSADLSAGILADGEDQSPSSLGGGGCGTDYPNLVPGEPQGFQNLFLRDNANGAYQLVDVTPAGAAPANAVLDAGSADLSHVVFDEQAQLTPDAPSGADDLYEWVGGTVRLVTYVPTGSATECGPSGPACAPAAGALAGGAGQIDFGAGVHRAVSADGSRIFFTSGGKLYVRLSGSRTVQVDASQASGTGGGGQFRIASSDGSQVFFSDDASTGLTSDTVPGSGSNLYRYNTDTGQLTDLTPQAAARIDGVLGTSEDGSYVYFAADGALAAGSTSGQPNVYLFHGGTTSFIATLSPTYDTCDWQPCSYDAARVTASGAFLAFTSTESPTGYDNTVSGGGNCAQTFKSGSNPLGPQCPEIFLYSAASNQLSCASCNPDGDPPTAGAGLAGAQQNGEVDFGSLYPTAYNANSVSDSGQVFFDTPDPLLPADTNGKEDVYEYDAGQLHLLSTGTTQDNSWFANATPSGSDVFFVTSQQLLPQDGDTSPDLYDARVDGGLPAPPTASAPCVGDACRLGSGPAPPPPLAASVTFFGPGNASAATPAAGRARILSRVVHGSTFLVRVEVPGKGRLAITGAGIRTVTRSVPRDGTYRLPVSLTAQERRALQRRHKLKLKLQVGYLPAGGQASAAIVSMTDER